MMRRKMKPDMNCQIIRHEDLQVRVMKPEETHPCSRIAKKGNGCRPPLVRCCSLEIITKIKENLRKNNLKEFRKSCFGHLLEMNPLRFQSPVLQHLLMHMDIAASNNNTTLAFNINNSKMEFGPHDFRFITGLSYGKSEAAAATTTTTSSRIHEDVFGSNPTIFFRDVEEAFLDVSGDPKGGGELTLKLALLYFLCGVVLPACHTKKIELRYLHLADNLHAFGAFPWGRVGYEFLASWALSARLRLDGSSAAGRHVFPGFTFALQVWAYENMPALATHCAARVHSFESNRILNWSATKSIRFDQLKQFFTLGDGGDNEEERRRMLSEDVVEPLWKALSAEASAELQHVKVEPLILTGTNTSIPQEDRRMQSEDVVESLPSSLPETERIKSIVALAFDDNPALDMPQSLGKTCSGYMFRIYEAEYKRLKALYEALLDGTKQLKLWVSYAQFEACAMIQGSGIGSKRKCLDRGRAVFERGVSYFRSCDPELKEERRMLLEAWFDMEYRFGEVGDVGSVRAKLPHKLKKRRRLLTEDGTPRYEEFIDSFSRKKMFQF